MPHLNRFADALMGGWGASREISVCGNPIAQGQFPQWLDDERIIFAADAADGNLVIVRPLDGRCGVKMLDQRANRLVAGGGHWAVQPPYSFDTVTTQREERLKDAVPLDMASDGTLFLSLSPNCAVAFLRADGSMTIHGCLASPDAEHTHCHSAGNAVWANYDGLQAIFGGVSRTIPCIGHPQSPRLVKLKDGSAIVIYTILEPTPLVIAQSINGLIGHVLWEGAHVYGLDALDENDFGVSIAWATDPRERAHDLFEFVWKPEDTPFKSL